MGYRLSSSTWRAPIQLIDSWLPGPSPSAVAPHRPLPGVVQLFSRAGWLQRGAAPAPAPDRQTRSPADAARPAASRSEAAGPARRVAEQAAPDRRSQASSPALGRPRRVRIMRTTDAATGCRPDARLVISGRISDVCAELDRLASLELRQIQPN